MGLIPDAAERARQIARDGRHDDLGRVLRQLGAEGYGVDRANLRHPDQLARLMILIEKARRGGH